MLPQIHFLPDDRKVQIRSGTSLLDAGRKAKVHIRTRCGGKAACLMCKVIVEDQAGLAPMKRNEELKLGDLRKKGYRLACQACAVADVTVHVPEDPLKAAVRRQLERQAEEDLW
jgi:2Fe-2S ferredoxin